MNTPMRNLGYMIRQLWNSAGFALTAILTLAVGIGGTVAFFSLFEAVLLRPLPFKDPSRLVSVHERSEQDQDELRLTAPDVLIFQRESKAFSNPAAFIASAYEVTGAGAPFEARAEKVSASLFPVLGVGPLLGRTFTEEEDADGVPVTVISYRLWKERFQADHNVLGRTLDLERRPYTIVGVMPRNFEFPLEAGRLSQHDLWVPMSFTPVEKQNEGSSFDFGLVARLKDGITPAQAQQDIDRVIARIETEYPGMARIGLHAFFLPLQEETVRDARPLLRILLGAVGLILLIACVNLANLLLVRAAGRKREFGVRVALGAGLPAIFWQVISESLTLSVIGGAAGTALAMVLVRAGEITLPESLPQLGGIGVRWPVLAFAAVLIVMTGAACGCVPAIAGMKINVLDSLRDGERGQGPGRAQHRLQAALVILEIAIAMVLLVASGLLLRSFARMLAVDPGFEPTHALTASLSLPIHAYPTQPKVHDFYQELQRRLEAIPGVTAVGFASNIPVVGQNSGRLLAPEGYVKQSGEGWIIASNYLLQGNYFEAMHIPLIRGRYFRPSDDQPGAPLAVIISQSLQNRYFAQKDPIGMHIKVGATFASPLPAMTIVGVVGDIKQASLDQPTVPEMYEPLAQAAADLGSFAPIIGIRGSMDVVIRTAGDPTAASNAFTQTVRQLDPLLAISNTHTMEEVVAATTSTRRFNTTLLTSFATIALFLALLGIYGTMAYAVAERDREIAVRMALGATRGKVLLGTLGKALTMAALGVAVGLVISAELTRFVNSLLFEVRTFDAVAMGGAILVLVATSAVAAWLPARRAASIEPMQLLRME